MNRGRLKTLIKILEHVRDEGEPFGMSRWTWASSVREAKCGTAACAFGHAVMHEPFKKLGLRWNRRVDSFGDVMMVPAFRKQRGLEAAIAFFGLEYEIAYDLFYGYGYPVSSDHIGPDHVIDRIEQLLKRDERKRARK